MMDLVVAMAPFVDEVTMTKTFELIRPYLEVRDVLCMLSLVLLNLSIFLLNCVVVCLFSDQGARHAEEGVPCAGGNVRRRER